MLTPYRISLRPGIVNFYYAIDSADGLLPGNVITTQNPYYLPTPPAGWDEVEVSDGRNLRYWGMERKYSAPYKFVLEGAKILRHLWYTNKRAAKCVIVVEKLNESTYQYETLFEANLNFRTAKDEDTHFSIEILQDGITGLIKSRENIEYEIMMKGIGAVQARVPAFKVKGRVQYMSSSLGNVSPGGPALMYYLYVDKTVVVDNAGNDPVSIGNANVTTPSSGGIMGQVAKFIGAGGTDDSPDMEAQDNCLFKARKAMTCNLKGRLDVTYKNTEGANSDLEFRILKYNNGSFVSELLMQAVSGALNVLVNHTFAVDLNFNLDTNDYIKVQFRKTNNTGVAYELAWGDKKDLILTFEHYTDEFTFTAFNYYRVLQELIKQVTDGQATLSSSLLQSGFNYVNNFDCNPKNLYITSSMAISKIGKPDPTNTAISYPVIKTTLADMFKDLDVSQSVGLGIEGNTIKLERKANFLNASQVIFTIDKPKEVTLQPATEFYFNSIKVGCENQTYDGVNGMDEFNTTQQWQLCKNSPITDNIKELDLVTKYRYDRYGVLFTHLNNVLLNKDGEYNSSSNSTTNNDIFVLELEGTPDGNYYNVKTWDTGYVAGVLDPANAFNMGLSPKRCLLRNRAFIKSFLAGYESDFIKYVSQEKNNQLESMLDYLIIDEDYDIAVSQLGPKPLFMPWIAEVECTSPTDYLQLIAAAPYGVIRVENWKGATIEGFPIQAGIKPSYPDPTYTFQLLLSPNNDLSTLIQ